MDIIEKYFRGARELNTPTTDKEISDLEKRLGTKLPDDYKSFLKKLNGFEGTIGQSYVRLNSVEEIENYTRDYCSEFYNDKVCIGTDGAGELFVVGKGDSSQKFGIVPTIGDENDYVELGDTLDKFFGQLNDGTFLE